MRAARTRTLAIGGVTGATAGVLVALTGNWWAVRHLPSSFGRYSESPLPDDTSFEVGTHWWQLIWPAALVGLVIGVVAALAFSLRGPGRSPARRWHPPLALGVVGAVLGLAVAATLYVRSGPDEIIGAPRRYVDYLPTSGDAYSSSLTLTFDDPDNVWTFVAVCGITGVALGLVAGVVLTVTRRVR